MEQPQQISVPAKRPFRYLDETKGDPEVEQTEGYTVARDMVQLFLPGLTLRTHFNHVRDMEIRQDDIILCAYAKCGTHWLWEILNMLVSGKTQLRKQQKETQMLDLRPVEAIAEIPSPRILNTHLPPQLLPREITEKRCRIVHIYRNPKDVTVSAYHHFEKAFKTQGITAGTLAEYKQSFISDNAFPYNFFKYTKEFQKFFASNPDVPVHVLSYEGLQSEPLAEVNRLAKFLEKKYEAGFLQEVVDACTFDNMKSADARYKDSFPGKTMPNRESLIYRKGQVGDWKTHFTIAESEMYDQIIRRELGDINISFRYQ